MPPLKYYLGVAYASLIFILYLSGIAHLTPILRIYCVYAKMIIGSMSRTDMRSFWMHDSSHDVT